MLEYIFFNKQLADEFKTNLNKINLEFSQKIDKNFGTEQGEIISIADNTPENILNDLQNLYDKLQDDLEKILEQEGSGLMLNAAGMHTTLKDGSTCTIRVAPEITTRILTVLEFEELQAFVDNIAASVQDPDSGHFCRNINR